MGPCLSHEDVLVYADSSGSAEQMDQWSTHIARCYRCARNLAAVLQDPARRSLSQARRRHVLEQIEARPQELPENSPHRQDRDKSFWDFLSFLWRNRLSREEKRLLERMVDADGRAVVRQEAGEAKHVLVAGEPMLDPDDDSIRERYLDALERQLVWRGLAGTYHGLVYELTPMGVNMARSLV